MFCINYKLTIAFHWTADAQLNSELSIKPINGYKKLATMPGQQVRISPLHFIGPIYGKTGAGCKKLVRMPGQQARL
jgi:hypothetical protein